MMNGVDEFVEVFLNYNEGYYFVTGIDTFGCLHLVDEWEAED